jgi:hypothetical protein
MLTKSQNAPQKEERLILSEFESYTLTSQLIYTLPVLSGPYIKIPNKSNVKNLHQLLIECQSLWLIESVKATVKYLTLLKS